MSDNTLPETFLSGYKSAAPFNNPLLEECVVSSPNCLFLCNAALESHCASLSLHLFYEWCVGISSLRVSGGR